jgi:hypothetical protein
VPLSKAQLDRMITRVDEALGIMKRRDSFDRDTDPKQFLETATMRREPIAEPPTMPQEDSAPAKIHGAGVRRDLFS